MSSALEAVVVILLLALPLRWLVGREIAIGEFRGHPIWASVRFVGMEYRFDRVADRRARERLSPRELFLDPGLVYITD